MVIIRTVIYSKKKTAEFKKALSLLTSLFDLYCTHRIVSFYQASRDFPVFQHLQIPLNPLCPKIHIQILQTGLHIYLWRIVERIWFKVEDWLRVWLFYAHNKIGKNVMLDYCVLNQVENTEIRALNVIHPHLVGPVPQILSYDLGHLLCTWNPREGSFRNV